VSRFSSTLKMKIVHRRLVWPPPFDLVLGDSVDANDDSIRQNFDSIRFTVVTSVGHFNCRSIKNSMFEVQQLCNNHDLILLQEH